ncbi:uncharacterized protein LOC125743116 isoform X2 [Brienomyrus brachyistius]|uniref:uncharacterized protein LOC125743116 isoform X1 n=1 Tax=Brienomyrus brachyistius TaxID=42636 RepID=UPI0020B35F10|nr:uncharacterized protein LOC125743116 isoform X1 [Brienomyrus brachyistius]XP_048871750.1 uncharacterized protein LOC125743116 isoform X1 [Brienomyrus brachyistius]XP_048871751.1 uncharacterized protein LOC125743116 isoform X2 [Brienomyrus brachyistius]XP_048871752.1 uncharacterized protein LOC125743116 isoform X1 [Brienomyrus brachyistius]XP_048871753.1 uncharacterized protein LOC125743116 isoform X2 [Brienomyrus brachyistius]
MAEVSQDLPNDCAADNGPEDNVVQVSSQQDSASSGIELNVDGDLFRWRIVRSRLGRRSTQHQTLQRVKCIVDNRHTHSESDLGRPAEKQRRRPMRRFNQRRPIPTRTKADTELVNPTKSDWGEPSPQRAADRAWRGMEEAIDPTTATAPDSKLPTMQATETWCPWFVTLLLKATSLLLKAAHLLKVTRLHNNPPPPSDDTHQDQEGA